MGMGSESSRQMEGPQGVPSTAANVCVHACQECTRASLNVSRPGHGKAHPSSPQARAQILTFVHTFSYRTVYIYTDNHALTGEAPLCSTQPELLYKSALCCLLFFPSSPAPD